MLPKSLKYVCDQDEGIRRKGRGKGFIYLNSKGDQIKDVDVLERIDSLVIPPNWKNVWICQDGHGYLQATGYDEKERKQYLYHSIFVQYRQKNKYDLLYEFGINLPVIRGRVQRDLKKEGWPKEKVLALIVKVMDEFHFRIGSEKYKDENETFGLTTLRRKHLKVDGNAISLEYKAKSGKYRKIQIGNKKLVGLIKETSELPGHEIFRYLDEDGKSRRITSQDVNDYIKEITQKEFTAKHFRTWGGTVAAIEESKEANREKEENPKKKLETAVIRRVAQRLGNTIATCREYYIHPKVLATIIDNKEIEVKSSDYKKLKYPHLLTQSEKKVLKIIEK